MNRQYNLSETVFNNLIIVGKIINKKHKNMKIYTIKIFWAIDSTEHLCNNIEISEHQK